MLDKNGRLLASFPAQITYRIMSYSMQTNDDDDDDDDDDGDEWFALENWQASCQFNLAYKQKKLKMF